MENMEHQINLKKLYIDSFLQSKQQNFDLFANRTKQNKTQRIENKTKTSELSQRNENIIQAKQTVSAF